MLRPDDFLDSLTHDTDLKFKEVQPFQLASISRPFNVKVIYMGVLDCAILVLADPWARSPMRHAPNPAIPNDVVDAALGRTSDESKKQLIADELLAGNMSPKPYIQCAALCVG